MLPLILGVLIGYGAGRVHARRRQKHFREACDTWAARCLSIENELNTLRRNYSALQRFGPFDFLGYSASMWIELRDLLKSYTPGRETPLQTAHGIIDEWNDAKKRRVI